MVRRAAALAFVLTLSPATLHAQDVVLTVNVASADVHKGPSTVTPVIGHVSRGTALPVLRNLGSWVKVPWPGAPDGIGYVHVTMGRLGPPNAETSSSNALPRGSSASAAASSSASGQTTMAPRSRPAGPHERVVVGSQQDATAISHVLGFGGVLGTMDSVGATARAWRDNRFGMQIGFTRDVMTGDVTAGRVTSIQVEPAVVYRLFDFVSDYFWIRPYVGSGLSIRRQTLHASAPVGAEVTPSNGVGLRVFGGTELTFAGLPRFALSVDVGYRRLPTPFAGFADDRVSASLSGHWYVK
jgi:hypothetical protein